MIHYMTLDPIALGRAVLIGKRKRKLYKACCKCGFTCTAYGKILVESQMEGHIKTFATYIK